MFFTNVIAVAGAFAVLANAASMPRATKCVQVESGFLETFIGAGDQALSLDSAKELTFGNGTPVKAIFQNCPATPNSQYQFNGRLVIQPASSNQCLTIINPSAASGPYFTRSAACTSDTTPSAAQLFGYGNDFGNVIFASGTAECGQGGAGLIVNDTDGSLILASRQRVQFGCSVSWQSMQLRQIA